MLPAPDQTFYNSIGSKPVDKRFWTTWKVSIGGFWSSQLSECLVMRLPLTELAAPFSKRSLRRRRRRREGKDEGKGACSQWLSFALLENRLVFHNFPPSPPLSIIHVIALLQLSGNLAGLMRFWWKFLFFTRGIGPKNLITCSPIHSCNHGSHSAILNCYENGLLCAITYPTDHFIIAGPQTPTIYVSIMHPICGSADFEDLKLLKCLVT